MSTTPAAAPAPGPVPTPLARAAAVPVPPADSLAGRFPLTPNPSAADDAARVRAAVRADMAARAEANGAGAPLVRSTSEIGDAIAAALRR